MVSSAVASSDVPPLVMFSPGDVSRGDVLLVAQGAALSDSALVFGGICPPVL